MYSIEILLFVNVWHLPLIYLFLLYTERENLERKIKQGAGLLFGPGFSGSTAACPFFRMCYTMYYGALLRKMCRWACADGGGSGRPLWACCSDEI